MSVSVKASYAKIPTATEAGVLGLRVTATSNGSVRPISVALVMDTSGSMDGARLTAVKNTLNVLVDKLLVGDKITIVGFSSKATLITANTVIGDADSRASLKAAVSALTADGGTNMESGVAMLGSVFTAGVELPDSVVMLTDGGVNEGITSIAGMCSLLKSYLPAIPVYALGYGEDHNAEFMRGLSARTNGTYTFLDTEIALPASIGDLLGGLQGEVAKAAELKFPSSWTCLELQANAGDTERGIGSLVSDKPTWLLFSVPAGTEVRPVGDLMLTFKRVGDSDTTFIGITVDETLDRIDVLEQQMRCVAATALDKAATLIKAYQMTEAAQTITAAIATITASEAASKPMAIRMKAQLEEMNEEITNAGLRHRGHAHVLLAATSSAARYTQQRGIGSHGGADDDMFSTPTLTRQRTNMVAQYSQSVQDPDAHDAEPSA